MPVHKSEIQHQSKYAARFILGVVVCVIASTTFSTAQNWVASTGTVDPLGGKYARFNGPAVYVDASAPIPTTITLRYNVDLAPPGTGEQGRCQIMGVRWLDNGSGARVVVRLKRYEVDTGKLTTLETFDSDAAFPGPSNNFQSQVTGCSDFDFDFASEHSFFGGGSLYYIVANLTRSASGGNPQLGGVWLATEIP